MTRKTRKTHKMLKVLLAVCCAALLVCVTIGATVAYLTSQDTVTNTFTVGNVQITLDEAKVGTNGKEITGTDAERVNSNEYKLFPGGEYDKEPTIHVDSKSEDAYLGVKVVFEGSKKADEKLNLDMLSIFSGFDARKWTIEEKTETDGDVYYLLTYKEVVSKNNNIVLFNKIMIPEDMTNDEIAYLNGIKMEITAYAVQKDGFDSAAVALSTAFNDVFTAPDPAGT